ncbi:hypothetical protein [Pseudomarimonas salicorniae]|uniref:Carboxypeptidase regulatory-like domain-containing protein n=1 Tax=Pseudomarimonas salicorniae TaxID=2933270 RepID=A0ABT0GFY7_9GAMM|nr:hypothetical protein [Lysobacter sp. CAU 1642]MCK7593453.1 hypothetical protein [Lysobacter sp. CAU 1642]
MLRTLVVASFGALLSCFPAIGHSACSIDRVYSTGFEVQGALTLRGYVAGLQQARVEVRQGAAVLNQATANQGAFTLQLPAGAAEAVIELRLRGLVENGQEFIELASVLGPRRFLAESAEADGTVSAGAVPALAVSPKSTARFSMLNSEVPLPATECQLEAEGAALDQEELLRRAAVIKLLIENGGVYASSGQSSKGSASTLDVLLSPTLLSEQVNAIEQARPGQLAATASLLGEDFCAYFQPEAVFISADADRQYNIFTGEVFRISDPVNGEHVNTFGRDRFTYECRDDQLIAQLEGERISVSYPVRQFPSGARQVQQEFRTRQIRVIRIDASFDEVRVLRSSQIEGSFPFENLPNEQNVEDETLSLIRQPTAAPFSEQLLRGTEWVLPSRQETTPASQLGVERLRFEVTGNTATQVDTGASMSWEVTPRGELVISSATRIARVIPLRSVPGATRVMTLVDFADGRRAASSEFAVRVEQTNDWEMEANVPATYLQNAGRVLGDSFFWRLSADRSAPAFSRVAGADAFVFRLHWTRDGSTSVVLRRCRGPDASNAMVEKVVTDREPVIGECTQFYRRREWTLLNSQADPDGVGRWLWVIEDNRDWSGVDPASSAETFRFYRTILYRRQANDAPIPKGEQADIDDPLGATGFVPATHNAAAR